MGSGRANRQLEWTTGPQHVDEVHFVFPMPPSVNEQYLKFWRGGRLIVALTKEAKVYQNQAKAIIAQNTDVAMGNFPVGDKELAYGISIKIFFRKLENDGWYKIITKGPRKGERDAQTRFSKVDTDNRVKFLQDCLCQNIGMPDDSQVFPVGIEKFQDKNNPRAEVTLRVIDVTPYLNPPEATGEE